MSRAIQCVDLKKTYAGKPPVEAVRGLNLEVGIGECFGLLGPNGAGKTTTMEILEGLLPATSGEVEVWGERWGGGKDLAIRERLGISLQETQLSDKLTVRETVSLFRSFYAKGIRPEAAIERVSLQEKSETWVKKLSGGQKQRLAVACALVGDPEVLFLDEPTTGLDPQSRRQLWETIRGFQKEGRTVLITTHYMDEAEQLCDRIAIVDHGLVISEGTPRELISRLGAAHLIEFSLSAESSDGIVEMVREIEGVHGVRREGEMYQLTVEHPHQAMPALVGWLAKRELPLASLATRSASLEDVFVALTGRHLRDGGEKS